MLPGLPVCLEMYCVPNLELEGEALELDGLGGELDPDCGLAVDSELLG
jgi:hypothetical protein